MINIIYGLSVNISLIKLINGLVYALSSDTLVSTEIVMALLVAIFFTVIYETSGKIWSGIVASMVWMVLGILYLVVYGGSSTFAFSLLYNGIGIFYVVRWMIDLVNRAKMSRRLEGDWD